MHRDPVIALGETWNGANATAVAERTQVYADKQDLLSKASDEDAFTDQLIAGCMVRRPSGKEPAQQEVHQAHTRLAAAQEEARQAKVFASDILQKFGISPLAVVPTALWNQITQAWGLYRFEHLDKDSKTHAHHVRKPETDASYKKYALCWFIVGLVLWIVAAGLVMSGVGYGWVFVLPGIMSSLFGFLTAKHGKHEVPRARKRVQEYEQNERTPGGFVPQLWPKGCDYTEEDARENVDAIYCRIDVRFPGAPESFGQKLLRLWKAGQHVCIAAAPQAIQVSLGTAEVIPNAEPIQYIQSPDRRFVAVLDRFGNFENEARAVQQAQDITAQYYA